LLEDVGSLSGSPYFKSSLKNWLVK